METVLKLLVLSLPQLVTCANLTYIPYYVDKDGSCLSNEGGIGDLPSAMPLAKRLKHVLQDMHMTYKYVGLCVQPQFSLRRKVVMLKMCGVWYFQVQTF